MSFVAIWPLRRWMERRNRTPSPFAKHSRFLDRFSRHRTKNDSMHHSTDQSFHLPKRQKSYSSVWQQDVVRRSLGKRACTGRKSGGDRRQHRAMEKRQRKRAIVCSISSISFTVITLHLAVSCIFHRSHRSRRILMYVDVDRQTKKIWKKGSLTIIGTSTEQNSQQKKRPPKGHTWVTEDYQCPVNIQARLDVARVVDHNV